MNKSDKLKIIYEKIADKTLSFWCQLKFKDKVKVSDDKKDFTYYKWLFVVYKYVRFWSSSSEWYDWYRIKDWECCFADFRTGELKFFTKESRESKYRSPEEWETLNDELVNKYFDIIWHQVMIWDVLDWIEKRIKIYYPMLMKKLNSKDNYFSIKYSDIKIVQDFIDKVGKWIVHIDYSGDYIWVEQYDIMNDGNLWELRKEKRKPIDDQSDECIDFIYELCKYE